MEFKRGKPEEPTVWPVPVEGSMLTTGLFDVFHMTPSRDDSPSPPASSALEVARAG
jgi:hypothetical protein